MNTDITMDEKQQSAKTYIDNRFDQILERLDYLENRIQYLENIFNTTPSMQ